MPCWPAAALSFRRSTGTCSHRRPLRSLGACAAGHRPELGSRRQRRSQCDCWRCGTSPQSDSAPFQKGCLDGREPHAQPIESRFFGARSLYRADNSEAASTSRSRRPSRPATGRRRGVGSTSVAPEVRASVVVVAGRGSRQIPQRGERGALRGLAARVTPEVRPGAGARGQPEDLEWPLHRWGPARIFGELRYSIGGPARIAPDGTLRSRRFSAFPSSQRRNRIRER
jgi:hypothetical protein